MNEWAEFRLEDLVEVHNHKRVPLSSMQRAARQGPYPYYGASGIIDHVDDFLFDGEYVLVSEDGENLKSRNTPIAFKATGQFWVNNHAHILRGRKNHLNDLIVYYFQNLDLHPYITGAVQPKLNKANLLAIPIYLPVSDGEQKAITAVLASLDDKIDLLHRQNKILEALAQTLFRHWFIEFQFPNATGEAYKDSGGKMVDSDIGEIPQGWSVVTLEDVTQRITDGAHSSPPSIEAGFPMASVKDMHQWGINLETCRHISEKHYRELVQNDCRPLENDILIAKDGSYLKHVFVVPRDLNVVLLSSIAILRPNKHYNPLLLTCFLKLESTRQEMENIVTGAVIPRIVLKDFRKFQLVLPPIRLQERALSVIEPIYRKCWSNTDQIRTLERLRDTLLPKLMSGEVRVRL